MKVLKVYYKQNHWNAASQVYKYPNIVFIKRNEIKRDYLAFIVNSFDD